MIEDRKYLLLKIAAVSFAFAAVYYLKKKKGEPMAGAYNPESIAGLAAQLVHPKYRSHARELGTALLNRFVG